MKKILSIMSIVLVFTSSLSALTLKEAETDNIKKPILVMVTMNHCSFCKKQKVILNQPEMAKYIKDNFQYLELNRSRVPLPEKLDSKYAPTIFVLTDYGEVITSIAGYNKADKLKYELDNALRELKRFNEIDKDLIRYKKI